MSLAVEAEKQWLSAEILPKILRDGKLVANYEESLAATLQVDNIEISVIGTDEAYMLTICYRALIEFRYAGEKQAPKKMVIKKTPKISPDLYDSIQFDNLFNNEVIFYTQVLPVLQEQTNGKFAAPRYYYSEIKAHSALIILGDFTDDGWSVTKDLFGLSLEHARIAVKYLGNFHGFGYAMKHTQPDRFQQLADSFREARYTKELSTEWELKHKTGLKRAELAANKYQPEVGKEFIAKFQRVLYSYLGYGRQRVAPREPLATLCHGDYLRNNVAYKYDTDNSGTPLEIMMFDYQTMRLSSPMIDLSVFLAISVLAEVRSKNFDSIFDDYCQALAESYCKNSNRTLPEFLSRENLLKEYIRFLPYAVHISCYFLLSLVVPPTTSPEEMFNAEHTKMEIVHTALTQGGELVDREIAHQVRELYDLSRKYNVELDENIDASTWAQEAIQFIADPCELFQGTDT